MSPLVGILTIVAGAIFLAVVVGAAGGAIHARLKGDLSLGALLVVGIYFLAVFALHTRFHWTLGVFGMLPLTLTFLTGSLATQVLETRLGLRPVFATLAALGAALLVGFSYLMLIRFDLLALTEPSTAWIAVALLSCLVVSSVWKWLRSAK